MATEGIVGMYVETRSYGAAAAFWRSLGFENVFETDHGSGQWNHPKGGPYVFIAEQLDRDLETHPILWVGDSTTFNPSRPPEYSKEFTPEHWGVVGATVTDPPERLRLDAARHIVIERLYRWGLRVGIVWITLVALIIYSYTGSVPPPLIIVASGLLLLALERVHARGRGYRAIARSRGPLRRRK